MVASGIGACHFKMASMMARAPAMGDMAMLAVLAILAALDAIGRGSGAGR